MAPAATADSSHACLARPLTHAAPPCCLLDRLCRGPLRAAAATAHPPTNQCARSVQRFAINPRAFFTQTITFVTDVARSVFQALEVVPILVDGDNNNDLPAITEAAQALVDAASRSVELMLFGLDTRASGMQRALVNSAGGLARGTGARSHAPVRIIGSLHVYVPLHGCTAEAHMRLTCIVTRRCPCITRCCPCLHPAPTPAPFAACHCSIDERQAGGAAQEPQPRAGCHV